MSKPEIPTRPSQGEIIIKGGQEKPLIPNIQVAHPPAPKPKPKE
jgi:hypothetical protein